MANYSDIFGLVLGSGLFLAEPASKYEFASGEAMDLCKWLGVAVRSVSVAAMIVRHWLRNFGTRRSWETDAKVLRRQAWGLLENDEFDDAIKLFDACLVQDPQCPDALRGRGLAIARKLVNGPANDNRQRPRRTG